METATLDSPATLREAPAKLGPISQLPPAPSKAAIAGHPIHPMLIPFPLAMLSLVPVTDIVFAVTDYVFWAWVSYYLLWGGIITAAVAGLVGMVDFIGVPRVRSVRAGWAHMLLNLAIVALSVVNLILRANNIYMDIVPSGLILSVVAFGLLIASGWFGGELSYRYRVGVADK